MNKYTVFLRKTNFLGISIKVEIYGDEIEVNNFDGGNLAIMQKINNGNEITRVELAKFHKDQWMFYVCTPCPCNKNRQKPNPVKAHKTEREPTYKTP